MVLLPDMATKKALYSAIKPAGFIVVECGTVDVPKFLALSSSFHTCSTTPADLLQMLDNVYEGTMPEIQEISLNTVFLDNISAFYWELKASGRYRYDFYRDLNLVLHKIRDLYKCNVVMTAWDSDFDRGFSHSGRLVVSEADYPSFMPQDVFSGARVIVWGRKEPE